MENVMLNSFQKLVQNLSVNKMLGDFNEQDCYIDWHNVFYDGVIYFRHDRGTKGYFELMGEIHENDGPEFGEDFDASVPNFENDLVRYIKHLPKIFWYRYIHRGFSLGCQPKGFVSHDDEYGRWGKVAYDRKLTEKEIADYELLPIIMCPICGNEDIQSDHNYCCICGHKLEMK